MKLFVDQNGSQFSQMIDKLFRILKKGGPKELITRGIVPLSPELRETAFAVSVDMIFADGSVEDEEKAVIEHLQSELGIPDAIASQILDVMVIKNRG